MVTRLLLLLLLLTLSASSYSSNASASDPSTSDSPTRSTRPPVDEASRDELVAWIDDLVWLVEDLRAERRIADVYSSARLDSVQRRLDLAEARLAWEREGGTPWWERWLLPAAVTVGVVLGAAVTR